MQDWILQGHEEKEMELFYSHTWRLAHENEISRAHSFLGWSISIIDQEAEVEDSLKAFLQSRQQTVSK
jgi:hypothetical protein